MFSEALHPAGVARATPTNSGTRTSGITRSGARPQMIARAVALAVLASAVLALMPATQSSIGTANAEAYVSMRAGWQTVYYLNRGETHAFAKGVSLLGLPGRILAAPARWAMATGQCVGFYSPLGPSFTYYNSYWCR